MYYKFEKGKQKALIEKAIEKAGSERKLAVKIQIPKGSLYALKFEKTNLSEKNLKKLVQFLGIKNKEELNIREVLSTNWGQIKGGKNLIKKKKDEGTMTETIEKLKKASSTRMTKWHKNMKENHFEKYHKWQYERFKKIGGGYKYKLTNGTKVRNLLEKEVGDFLIKHFPKTNYEPYLNIDGKAYFPDFLYRNVIIEVTEWKNPSKEKISQLQKKLVDYQKKGYTVCFFIPYKYRKFYKIIEKYQISALHKLKEYISASVA